MKCKLLLAALAPWPATAAATAGLWPLPLPQQVSSTLEGTQRALYHVRCPRCCQVWSTPTDPHQALPALCSSTRLMLGPHPVNNNKRPA